MSDKLIDIGLKKRPVFHKEKAHNLRVNPLALTDFSERPNQSAGLSCWAAEIICLTFRAQHRKHRMQCLLWKRSSYTDAWPLARAKTKTRLETFIVGRRKDAELGGRRKEAVEAVEKLRAQKGKLERVSRHITKDKKTGAVPKGFGVGVEQARRTGIDIVGDVAWGMHFCIFYQSKQDLTDILVPYFKAGLENNEFCMWVTSEPLNAKEAMVALTKEVKDLSVYIKKGQIEILDYSQWYAALGKFDADMVLQGWADKEQQARRMGFDGLRLTGNTFWLEKKDWKEFSDYEAALNDIIGKYKMLVICTYFLDKCNATEVIDVVCNHQFALIKREGEWSLIEDVKRKKADEEILALSKFPSENPSPVLRIAKDGEISYSNKPGLELLAHWNVKIGEKAPERWRCLVKKTLESAKPGSQEEEVKDKIFSVVIAPVVEAGYVNLYARDITERKKAEAEAHDTQRELIEQQRHEKERVKAELAKVRDKLIRTTRLAAIGQVSASIAHDLRNPLGAVRNASYFLKRRLSGCEPKVSEHLEIIDQEITKADNIITNLLEMARPKVPHKQSLDFAEIVKDVFDHARGTQKVCCRISAVPDPFIVRADPNQLRQVISNILDNAIDAMKGQGEVLVQTSRDSEYDTLVFRDTGPGFDPQVKAKIFEPLVTTKASGTGLGLTICRQIVEKHGGTIDAEDCKGGGAVIRIRLQRQ